MVLLLKHTGSPYLKNSRLKIFIEIFKDFKSLLAQE